MDCIHGNLNSDYDKNNNRDNTTSDDKNSIKSILKLTHIKGKSLLDTIKVICQEIIYPHIVTLLCPGKL